jgi:hypothetical protein
MGVLINLLYVSQLSQAFLAQGHERAIARYIDPQILLTSTVVDSAETHALLELARGALANSVGVGLLMCAGLGVIALLVLYRLPPVRLVTLPTLVAPQNNKT